MAPVRLSSGLRHLEHGLGKLERACAVKPRPVDVEHPKVDGRDGDARPQRAAAAPEARQQAAKQHAAHVAFLVDAYAQAEHHVVRHVLRPIGREALGTRRVARHLGAGKRKADGEYGPCEPPDALEGRARRGKHAPAAQKADGHGHVQGGRDLEREVLVEVQPRYEQVDEPLEHGRERGDHEGRREPAAPAPAAGRHATPSRPSQARQVWPGPARGRASRPRGRPRCGTARRGPLWSCRTRCRTARACRFA